jgi:ribosomal protein S3
MNITRNNASLISKFIARFFRSFHRTKKIYKFLSFLSKFIQCAEAIYQEKNSTQGLKFQIKGRFSGTPRSRIRIFERGRIPLQTVISKIDYSLIHVNTSYGVFGVKVWISE